MSSDLVVWTLDEQGVATVTLNRPGANNAYNDALISALLSAVDELARQPVLRAVVLTGAGKYFQAGADLHWINTVRSQSDNENVAASRQTFEAVQRLNRLPVPTVALVQGACFGGGTGVMSACDVVIAADDSVFSITEVRWGLTAAIIIPQLCDAIGVRQVRRYALTGERFDAEEARRIGLVHEIVPRAGLEAAGARIVEHWPTRSMRSPRRSGWLWKAHRAAWRMTTRRGLAWSGCMRPSARRLRPAKALPPSPRNARRIGNAKRTGTGTPVVFGRDSGVGVTGNYGPKSWVSLDR